MTTKAPAPQAEIGYAATATGYSWWAYEGETTPELQWPQSVEVYDAMRRTDSQVASVLRAVTLPVRRTPWRIDPAGARAEVVEFVADDLGLPIVGQNPKVMPRTKDRFSWPEHLRLALLMLSFGFSYFEQTYRVDPDGNRAHLHKLGPRPARTIANVDVARDGGLVSITQWGQIGTQAPQAPIPVGRIVAYVCEREGGNWLGQSLLRTCYKNWLIKDRLLRVQAQTIERNGMGVPLYKAAETETELATGLGMATAWRAGEAAGSAIPFGADLVLRGVEGTLPDALPAIEYHDSQIARAVLAHFLNLGTQTGSWALGTTFADFFTLSLQTLAQQIADTATQHIIEDLVDINFGEDEPAPRLTFDEIGSRQAATAQALKSLADAGFVHPDEVLEESTRQQFGLPPKDESTTFAPPVDVSGDGGPHVPEPTSDRPGSVAAAGDAGPKGGAALAAEAVTAKFNPDEPRNPATGEWISVGGLLDFDALESLYGELIDERSVGDFNVSYYAHGDMTLSVDYDDKRLILADGFDQANTTRLADGLEWAASADPDGDEAIDDTGLVDYDEFTDSGVIVGYDPSGDVRISAPAGNDDEVHEFDVSPEEASGLADALRDMWAANEEAQADDDGGEVTAAWDPTLHPRNKDGRFRSLADRILDAITHHQEHGGKGHADPFEGFDREQLRKAAKARGIDLKRGESRESIAAKLLADVAPGKKRSSVSTWEELGKPQGPPPVGVPIGHEGGTYERLPGEPRRYRVINAEGKDISDQVITAPGRNQTAEDARAVLRVDVYDRQRVQQAHDSGAVAAWDSIPGAWFYDSGEIKGFRGATAAQKREIRAALDRWTGHKSSVDDATRQAEPTVNSALRGAIPLGPDVQADIQALDLALSLSRTKKPITVYRGVTNGAHILPDDWQDRDLSGLEWSTNGYTPTTGNLEAAEAYVGFEDNRGFMMRIELPKGSSAVAIRDAIGGLDDEGEIVLPRGLRFRVVKDNGPQGEFGLRQLDVEIVTDVPGPKPAPRKRTPRKPTAPKSGRVEGADRTSDMDSARRVTDTALADFDTFASRDKLLASVTRQQGFDGKPTVVSPEQMDKLISSGAGELWRGVEDKAGLSAAQIHEQFRTGDAFWGTGMYGNGFYFAQHHHHAESFAQDYGEAPGSIMRATLMPGARVVTKAQLEAMHRDWLKRAEAAGLDTSVLGEWGKFAAASGIDAYTTVEGSTVVLNRTAMVVEAAL
jgi:hypothetical protein